VRECSFDYKAITNRQKKITHLLHLPFEVAARSLWPVHPLVLLLGLDSQEGGIERHLTAPSFIYHGRERRHL
jgi:hypothetical protein